ncbi:unnamed protein product, partial [Parnassius apollo]
RSYLETFGYLKKGQPEVGNLLMGDVAQSYEDEFRIAVKTLQEFGGIPVTGEIDEATKELIKKRRCGRPDREEGDFENGKRKKSVANGVEVAVRTTDETGTKYNSMVVFSEQFEFQHYEEAIADNDCHRKTEK